jgi:hypothetical protein
MDQVEIPIISFLELISTPPGVYVHHSMCVFKDTNPKLCTRCKQGFFDRDVKRSSFMAVLDYYDRSKTSYVTVHNIFRIRLNDEKLLQHFRDLTKIINDFEIQTYNPPRFQIVPPTIDEIQYILDYMYVDCNRQYIDFLTIIENEIDERLASLKLVAVE